MGQDGKCYGVDATFCVCILTGAGRERRGNAIKKDSQFCESFRLWELRESNPRPSACKADALNQLS